MNALMELLNNPTTPNWVRAAIRHALNADPVDFANQAETLAQVASAAATEILIDNAQQSLRRRIDDLAERTYARV